MKPEIKFVRLPGVDPAMILTHMSGPGVAEHKPLLRIAWNASTVAFRQSPKGCIHHTDHGSQYCSHDYQKLLRQHDFKVSPLMHVNMHCRAVDELQRKLL